MQFRAVVMKFVGRQLFFVGGGVESGLRAGRGRAGTQVSV